MTKTVGIGLIGAGGRVCLEIAKAALAHPETHIASALERPDAESAGQDIGALLRQDPVGVVVGTDLETTVRAADVVVDLSHPRVTASVIDASVAAKKPLLSGTTGIDRDTLSRFDTAGHTIPVLYASNLSPGITLLTSLVAQAAAALNTGYDIEVMEMHHRNKVDAPSGTALTLAEAAAGARGLDPAEVLRHGRSGHTGIRTDDEIGMHALRGGSVFGDHTIVLASQNERLELTHKASSRGLFGEGAVRATLFLATQAPGRYTMQDALGL